MSQCAFLFLSFLSLFFLFFFNINVINVALRREIVVEGKSKKCIECIFHSSTYLQTKRVHKMHKTEQYCIFFFHERILTVTAIINKSAVKIENKNTTAYINCCTTVQKTVV